MNKIILYKKYIKNYREKPMNKIILNDILNEKELIKMYNTLQIAGFYDKNEITEKIIQYVSREFDIDMERHDYIPTYIMRIIDNYATSTYKNKLNEAFDDAMSIV